MIKLTARIAPKKVFGTVLIRKGTTGSTGRLQMKVANPSEEEQAIMPDTGYSGLSVVTVTAAPLQTKTMTPDRNTHSVKADSGFYGLKEVVVNPVVLQQKTVAPQESEQFIEPDSGYSGLYAVKVEAAKLQEKSTTVITNANQVFTADEGFYGLKKVTVPGLPSAEEASF